MISTKHFLADIYPNVNKHIQTNMSTEIVDTD